MTPGMTPIGRVVRARASRLSTPPVTSRTGETITWVCACQLVGKHAAGDVKKDVARGRCIIQRATRLSIDASTSCGARSLPINAGEPWRIHYEYILGVGNAIPSDVRFETTRKHCFEESFSL